jgi:hypothetical protein
MSEIGQIPLDLMIMINKVHLPKHCSLVLDRVSQKLNHRPNNNLIAYEVERIGLLIYLTKYAMIFSRQNRVD